MTKILHSSTVLVLHIVLIIITFSCKTKTEEVDPPKEQFAACQNGLVTHYRSDGAHGVHEIRYEYEFEPSGLIRKLKATFTGKYFSRGDGTKPFIQTTFYTYDKDGFLLSRKITVQNPSVLQDTWGFENESYEYKNGKLIKTKYDYVTVFGKDSIGTSHPYTYTYDYDSNGRLVSFIKKSDKYDISDKYSYGYDSDGLLNSYNEDHTGNQTSYTYVFSKGKVFEMIYNKSNEKTKYFYDLEDQLIKQEHEYSSGRKFPIEYSYDNKDLPTTYLNTNGLTITDWKLSSFKGHPIIPNIFGQKKHNLITLKSEVQSRVCTYRYNNFGKPIDVTVFESLNGNNETSKAVLEYCQ